MVETSNSTLLFYVPHYLSRSNGISTLYNMALCLSMNGFKIGIKQFGLPSGELLPAHFRFLIEAGEKVYEEAFIAVYPDIVTGNPLSADKIIRLLMAPPGIFDGQKTDLSKSADYFMAFSYAVSRELPQVNFIKDEIDLFESIRKTTDKKEQIVIYYGKTRNKKAARDTLDLIGKYKSRKLITRFRPTDRKDALKIIAESEVLVCHDPLSNLAYESTLLGTPCFISDDLMRKTYETYNYKLHGFFYELNQFQEAKQSVKHAFHQYKNLVAISPDNLVREFDAALQYLHTFDIESESDYVAEYNSQKKRALEEFKFINAANGNIRLRDRSLVRLREVGACNYSIYLVDQVISLILRGCKKIIFRLAFLFKNRMTQA